jgi:hypothetical protein
VRVSCGNDQNTSKRYNIDGRRAAIQLSDHSHTVPCIFKMSTRRFSEQVLGVEDGSFAYNNSRSRTMYIITRASEALDTVLG